MASPSSTSPPSGRTKWFVRLGLATGAFVLAAGVFVYATLFFGAIEGQEFSPTTFKRREFSYYELPLLRLQVSPIDRSDATGEVERLLTEKKLVKADKSQEERWDLVSAQRSGMIVSRGDAEILCSYLDISNSDDERVWIKWTEQHPEMAKLFWPIVARLARHELYIFLPDVLKQAEYAAREQLPLDAFRDRLHRILTSQYRTLADAQQKSARHEQAVELLTEGLRYDPGNRELLRARAESFEALGKNQEAAADRQKVTEASQKMTAERAQTAEQAPETPAAVGDP